MSNPDLDRLQPYPFQRLAALREGVQPPADRDMISLAMGEPRHPAPGFVAEALIEHTHGLARYPATRGDTALREAICSWLSSRFQVPAGWLDPERHALPVNGTREALFAFAQAMVDRGRPGARVLMPNPFYQIYEGAALLAGAEPRYLDATPGGQPDFDAVPAAAWRDCQLLYICTPGNPTGAVLDNAQLQRLIRLADEHDFIIAADECYSEIYPDEANPPPGLLQACAAMGRSGFERCVVFHSLSKRSNLPGLRSGFVAGDAELLAGFLLYRTYHGCAMPPATQAASIAAWSDEAHVRENRALYRQKFDAVLDILGKPLGLERPQAGFYLWPEVPERDTDFTLGLWREEHVAVLPGSFLARDGGTGNPGARRVRMALVAEPEACVVAAQRIRRYLQ
ncbi:succinyldiaminopimelate transaminase [Alkalilimnicola ehrlichii MLHE-1]|uniref:Aminotransferase n=1 Tax=Alkalilimnicola ehrlichii (strain ATCC BAA-1101 / DSM 17681 / MLHE-1) TaxID=187272 RepID=Q0A7H7_ALKEH|nr:succinyldiaminopimelate transaminase [Alkalilimnicola ehrlichii]ABI57210.1 aminotransferase [Alkalilimnicola ehrlichii MLHE-1]